MQFWNRPNAQKKLYKKWVYIKNKYIKIAGYLGCYADDRTTGLTYLGLDNDLSMTIEKCSCLCQSNNYLYAGLQHRFYHFKLLF